MSVDMETSRGQLTVSTGPLLEGHRLTRLQTFGETLLDPRQARELAHELLERALSPVEGGNRARVLEAVLAAELV